MTNSLRAARLISVALSLVFAGAALAQTTVTLQNGSGYAGTTDAWISCCDAAAMTFGLNNDMELRGEASDSGVIRFAIFQSEGGPVPDGATINSAVLSLYKYDGPDAVFRASRLLKGWNEAQVTWNNTATSPSTLPWSVPGARGAGTDYVAGSNEEGSVTAANGCMTSPFPASCWLNINVTSSVNLLANGSAQNFGWKIAQASSSAEGAYKNFVSKDNVNFETLRPKLTITYDTIPSGGGECSAPGVQLCVQFEAEPDTTFFENTVTSQSVGGSIDWSAQNAAPDDATDTNRIALVSGGRDGSSAIKLQTLDDDSEVHSSEDWERSEIQLRKEDTAAIAGTDSWWADSLYIPADSVLPSTTETQLNLFQFHGNIGSAPNFGLSIINQTGNNPHKVFRAYTAGGSPTGTDGMGTQYTYLIDNAHRRIGQCISDDVQLGVWYDFVHHIRWSSTGNGSHEIWMRKAGGTVMKVLDKHNISTVYTGDMPYLKVGVYHSPVLGMNTSVVHDRIRRGNSADAVRLPDFPVVANQSVTPCVGTSP